MRRMLSILLSCRERNDVVVDGGGDDDPDTVLTEQPMVQADAGRMIRHPAVAAGVMAPIGNHSFRATSITAYLSNGGALEHGQSMAAHESPGTTKLYDRTNERLTQDEVEKSGYDQIRRKYGAVLFRIVKW